MSQSHIAAFFDFDNTLIRGDSQAFELKHEMEMGRISTLRVLQIAFANILYTHYQLSPEKMNRIFLKYYKGKTEKAIKTESEEIYSKFVKPAIAKNIAARLKEHQDEGHRTVIISASAKYIIRLAAKELNVNEVICTKLLFDKNGYCTGKPDGHVCIGNQKSLAALNMAEKYDLRLSESYAYSDHHADLPLLRAVGHPIVVEPTGKLRQIAEKRGWSIMNF